MMTKYEVKNMDIKNERKILTKQNRYIVKTIKKYYKKQFITSQ